jgi:2',3'-cyclic-nucleotide 2'-phosphodiesterase (5'-nucleotidase family)
MHSRQPVIKKLGLPRCSTPRPGAALALLVLMLVGAAALGAAGPPPHQRKQAGATRTTGQAPGISLVWTGEQNGHLEPCGCSKPQLGGMVRRAGLLRSLPVGPSLRLDNGDLTEARGRQDELKAETSIQLLNQLTYTAINLGEADLRLGLPYLQSLAGSFKGTLLCANARDAADHPLFHEYVLRRFKVGQKEFSVAMVGLLSERYAPEAEALNPGMKIASAGDTLDRLRPVLAGHGFVILLFHGEPEEARQLTAGQDWIGAVIVAHAADDRAGRVETPASGGKTGGLEAAGKATDSAQTLLTVGRDGKYVGQAEIVPPRVDGGSPRLADVRGVDLGPTTPEDSTARAIEAAYLQRVADEKLLEKVPRVTIPDGDHFAGSAACASCHPAAHRTWAASAHSHAWATLVHAGHQRDPDCVGCHVVGLEYLGGFQDAARTPQLENVGCEYCHQAAGRHAASPATVRPPKIGAAVCSQCHTPEQSPGFDFNRFWAKIRH